MFVIEILDCMYHDYKYRDDSDLWKSIYPDIFIPMFVS